MDGLPRALLAVLAATATSTEASSPDDPSSPPTAPVPLPAEVHREAVYGVNITSGIPYGRALYCNAPNFSQVNCSVIELLLDVLAPTLNESNQVPLPTTPMPVLLGIHGGSYSHGDSSMEHANVAYFVQRGWIGFSINYRVCNQKPYVPPSGTESTAFFDIPDVESAGNLVCSQFGSFPTHPPYGNASCTEVKNFGLGTADGCPLSSPPKLGPNSTGHGRPGSFFGTLMAWVRTTHRLYFKGKHTLRRPSFHTLFDSGADLEKSSGHPGSRETTRLSLPQPRSVSPPLHADRPAAIRQR